MAKRPRENGHDDGQARKAPKRDPPPEPVPINSVKDLRQLLHFRQDNVDTLKTGQFSFKAFLDSIINDKDGGSDKTARLSILRQYLEAEPSDLIQIWSFAAQTDNDRLVTLITSNIALLLRTLSSLLDFRDLGLAFARAVLEREQLKLLARGLTAESHKEALISPCLRILTEVVSFDGGVLAAQVLKNQDLTFNTKFLDRNLRLGRSSDQEDRRNSSVRSNTIRYILALVRHQDVDGRIQIIDMRSIFRNWLEHVRNDPAPLVSAALKTLESSILRNMDIPRRYKSSIISDKALASIIDAIRGDDTIDQDFEKVAWSFLDDVCTFPDLGVVLPCSWYGAPAYRSDDDIASLSAGEQSIPTAIRNSILSKFIQHLRPHVVLRERQLLLAIFKAAPELVADYIRQATSRLPMQPKLTNTWIGYASLLFSIVDVPVPAFFGASTEYRSEPPPAINVVENILPAPLTQDVLKRCLNQNSTLVTFFALRIMVAALIKLQKVIGMQKTAAAEHATYEDATFHVVTLVSQRLPSFKDIYTSFRAIPDGHVMSKEAAAHLIALHQDVLPLAPGSDTFDVATPLATTFRALQAADSSAETRMMTELQLAHLLHSAESSQGVRWWQRQAGLDFSPFVTIVMLCCEKSPASRGNDRLENVAAQVAFDDGVLQSSTELSAADALFASLESGESFTPGPDTWLFVEDCLSRVVKKPVRYLDDLDKVAKAKSITDPVISLLAFVVAEQLPFTTGASSTLGGEAERANVWTWASRFLSALVTAGEDKKIIKELVKSLNKTNEPSVSTKEKTRPLRPRNPTPDQTAALDADGIQPHEHRKRGLALDLTPPPPESATHPELLRYKKQALDELLQSGTLDKLILCLSSRYPEIRRQGLAALEDTMAWTKSSSLDSRDQLWLLLGELVETARGTPADRPVSAVAAAFAAAALRVVQDPAHLMFPLVNRFLVKDPYWNVRKLPGYFLDRTLLEAPEERDAFWARVEWVLRFLVDGVRSGEDVRVVTHRSGMERVLALVASPGVTAKAHGLVLQLVHRVVVADGSTGLVTNAGLLAWMRNGVHGARFSGEALRVLHRAIDEGMDKEKVAAWRGW